MDRAAYLKLVEIINQIEDEAVLIKLTNVIDQRISELDEGELEEEEDDDTEDDEDDKGEGEDDV